MRFQFVAKHRGVWPVTWICEVLDVSPSGFYDWLNRPRAQRRWRLISDLAGFADFSSRSFRYLAG